MKRQPINTVEEATGFLHMAGVEVIGTAGGWIVRELRDSPDGYELTCDSDADLIAYARMEQDLVLGFCRKLGLTSLAELPQYSSCSPIAENRDLMLAAWVYGLLSGDNTEVTR